MGERQSDACLYGLRGWERADVGRTSGAHPGRVFESLSDLQARLYYRFYLGDLSYRQAQVKIWFDREADYLEVLFDQREGFFRETENDQVMSICLRHGATAAAKAR
jgi:hypothetical protein